MKSFEQLAHQAFMAYRDARITLCQGAPILWDDLDEPARNAWLAVARRIVDEMATVH